MAHKLAIDFGTTNSVVVHWDEDSHSAKPLLIPGLSSQIEGQPPLIPSLLYIKDGCSGQMALGNAAQQEKLDHQKDNRLFRSFTRHYGWHHSRATPD